MTEPKRGKYGEPVATWGPALTLAHLEASGGEAIQGRDRVARMRDCFNELNGVTWTEPSAVVEALMTAQFAGEFIYGDHACDSDKCVACMLKAALAKIQIDGGGDDG